MSYTDINTKSLEIPLLSWGVFLDGFNKMNDEAKKKIELDQVLKFSNRFGWNNDLHSMFLENEYEALVITDISQKIIWVNDGFTHMTGYPKSFAIHKTPKFLQGAQTLSQTRKRIKNKIATDKPFKDVIINHRADNSPYECEIKIFPLSNKETTHYIAFEKELIN